MPSLSPVAVALQVGIAAALLNVWLLRARRATPYRGGTALTLREEFRAYGLPTAAFYVVGALKIGAALVLLAGLFWGLPVTEAALVVAALMVGAIAMHARVGDPVRRSLPALVVLGMAGALLALR